VPTPTTVRDTAATIGEFFTRFGAGDRPGMLELFAPDVDFVVAGAEEVVPWAGKQPSLAGVEEFLRIALEDISTEKFAIAKILVDGEDGVVLGEFAHRIHRTDQVFASTFALHIRVRDERITKYHMFEDSHRAALAWQD
jgi:ketosteroid isomerase-like protein